MIKRIGALVLIMLIATAGTALANCSMCVGQGTYEIYVYGCGAVSDGYQSCYNDVDECQAYGDPCGSSGGSCDVDYPERCRQEPTPQGCRSLAVVSAR